MSIGKLSGKASNSKVDRKHDGLLTAGQLRVGNPVGVKLSD
jgi:hypothetical protein